MKKGLFCICFYCYSQNIKVSHNYSKSQEFNSKFQSALISKWHFLEIRSVPGLCVFCHAAALTGKATYGAGQCLIFAKLSSKPPSSLKSSLKPYHSWARLILETATNGWLSVSLIVCVLSSRVC